MWLKVVDEEGTIVGTKAGLAPALYTLERQELWLNYEKEDDDMTNRVDPRNFDFRLR